MIGIIAALAVVAGCSSEPQVTQGTRVSASLAAVWDMGESPGRQAIFSADGKFLAASNAAGDLVVRRRPDWKVTHRLRHPGGATSMAITPDSRTLISAGYDGRVHLWDLGTGKHRVIPVATGTIWTLDVAPDGSRIAAGGEDKLVRLQPLDGKPATILRGHDRNIWEVRFHPRGQAVASGSFDATARIWDLRGQRPKLLRGHTQAVVGLDFSPDGRILATSGDDSTIRFWRAGTGSAVRTIAAGNHVYKIDFSPDGAWLASAGRARGAMGTAWYGLTGLGSPARPVKIWRVKDGALVAALSHPTDVFSVSVSPDGRLLATNDDAGDVRLWQLRQSD